MRIWYNGCASGFHPDDASSILAIRSKLNGATPQSLKAAMSNLDNAEYFNTYGAKATRKKDVIKAIIIGGLLGALFAVIVNVIAHTLN